MTDLAIGARKLGRDRPTYFIADISANHDGDLGRAKELCRLAKDAGADAAKFQNFRAAKIVSRHGFEAMGSQVSHQAKWKKSVYEVYEAASIPFSWTPQLKRYCDSVGIEYLSTPYDVEAVDMLEPHVQAYKIGSGDVNWTEMLDYIARKGKPVLLAVGASDMSDVQRAVRTIRASNPNLVLMQCNTNYTGSRENLRCINLNVLKTFQALYPDLLLGLSDHTAGHATVLGAVALGARVIEKHFTDDTQREGPDHPFSMTPASWREMVDRTRELEQSLGNGEKVVEENERETVVVQRRCLRAARDLATGARLERRMIDVLRPAPPDAILPQDLARVVGARLTVAIKAGQHLSWSHVEVANPSLAPPPKAPKRGR